MKTYTIRPLEWEGPEYWQYSRVLSGTYHACVRGSGAYWSFNPHSDADDAVSGCPDTIAAAKELAWQDWLRRITPALEEVK